MEGEEKRRHSSTVTRAQRKGMKELMHAALVEKEYVATMEDELNLSKGETIIVFEVDDSGWATGSKDNDKQR